MAQPTSRLAKAGILQVRHGTLRMSDRFIAHLSLFRHRGHVPSWDILALLEAALSAWDEYAGDARQSARTLVRFLPPGTVHATPSFPVLEGFIAA